MLITKIIFTRSNVMINLNSQEKGREYIYQLVANIDKKQQDRVTEAVDEFLKKINNIPNGIRLQAYNFDTHKFWHDKLYSGVDVIIKFKINRDQVVHQIKKFAKNLFPEEQNKQKDVEKFLLYKLLKGTAFENERDNERDNGVTNFINVGSHDQEKAFDRVSTFLKKAHNKAGNKNKAENKILKSAEEKQKDREYRNSDQYKIDQLQSENKKMNKNLEVLNKKLQDMMTPENREKLPKKAEIKRARTMIEKHTVHSTEGKKNKSTLIELLTQMENEATKLWENIQNLDFNILFDKKTSNFYPENICSIIKEMSDKVRSFAGHASEIKELEGKIKTNNGKINSLSCKKEERIEDEPVQVDEKPVDEELPVEEPVDEEPVQVDNEPVKVDNELPVEKLNKQKPSSSGIKWFFNCIWHGLTAFWKFLSKIL